MTYGLAGPADVRAEQIRFGPEGMAFRVIAGAMHAEARLPAWGRHNVANALAATAVGLVLGMDLGTITAGMARWTPPAKRLQPIHLGHVLVINDTYNSSPASVRAALDVLEEIGRGRRVVVVLGEMRELGAQSGELHRDVGGDLARRKIARVLTVGAGADAIGEGAAAAGVARNRIEHAPTVEEATTRLRAMLQAGDVVLIKGSRALELERIVAELERALLV